MRIVTGRRALAPLLAAAGVIAVLAVSVAATPESAASLTGAGAAPATSIEILDAASRAEYIQIITATSAALAAELAPPGTATPQYVPAGLITDVTWTAQTATEDDPTNSGSQQITSRTAFMFAAAVQAGLTTPRSAGCVGERSANPTSDHPAGRACDLMFDYSTAAGVAAGWRAANWLVANQAALGVRYVIWQGVIWNAQSRPGPYIEYRSTAYGCPNPANITGCHYDHVHVSMF